MTHTVFIDLDSHLETASASGTAAPDVPLKHLTRQTLAFAFHSGGTVSAVTGWSTGRVVIKATPTSDVLLLDTTLIATGSTTSTRYSAEWAAVDCDSAALRTLIGASVEPLDVFAEIQWTADSGTHAVAFPIQIVPTFNLPEDDPPDPTESASWTWLKARLAAGSNVTFTDNDTTQVRTIAASGGGGGGGGSTDWGDIGGTLSDQTDLQTALNNKQPLAANLTTLAGGGSPLATTVVIWDNVDQQYEFGLLPISSLATIANNSILGNVSGGTTQPSALTSTQVRTMLSIGNVENTALSTWAGSANITTLGTIASGVWQGTAIAPAYLGSGSDITGKFLRGDGTWQTVSSGLTIGTTAITSGTSGRVLYNNGGVVGELSTFYRDAFSQFFVDSSTYYGYGVGSGIGVFCANGSAFYFSPFAGGIGTPVELVASSAYALAMRSGTNAIRLNIFNTYTSGTNHEVAVLDWQTTTNTLRIGSDIGSGGGTARAMNLITGGVTRIALGAAGELGFFGATAIAKPEVTGSRGGNAALESLLTGLANLGLITNSSS